MILEIVLFVIIVLIGAGDCWSTYKGLKYNEKFTTDMKFRRKVLTQMRKELKEDQTKIEASNVARGYIKKYGPDRAMIYIFVFGYEPICLSLLYLSLISKNPYWFIVPVFLVGLMIGILYRQILFARIRKKRFGI